MKNIIKTFNFYFEKNNYFIIDISLICSVFYFFIRFIDCLFLIEFPIGDERVFVKEFNFFIQNGMIESLRNGMSTLFILFSIFIDKLTGLGYFSLRIASAISSLILIFYFYHRLKFSNLYDKKTFFTFLLFLIPTTGAQIHATNDSMFFLALSVFIFESFLIDKNRSKNLLFRILSSFIMIITRPVIIVYLGILFIGTSSFYLITKRKNYIFLLKDLSKPLLLGIFATILISTPKLLNKEYSLSFSDKSIFEERGVTWTEWVYHSQKIGNSSSRYGFFTPMIKWERAYDYKKKYGDKSLPDTYLEYLTHDVGFLIRRTFSSLFEILIISIRYVGFLLFIVLIYTFKKYFDKDFDRNMLFNFIALSGILTWAFIWPGLVQHRWLYPFYLIIVYSLVDENKKLKNFFNFRIISYNLVIVDIIIIWFLFKEGFFAGI